MGRYWLKSLWSRSSLVSWDENFKIWENEQKNWKLGWLGHPESNERKKNWFEGYGSFYESRLKNCSSGFDGYWVLISKTFSINGTWGAFLIFVIEKKIKRRFSEQLLTADEIHSKHISLLNIFSLSFDSFVNRSERYFTARELVVLWKDFKFLSQWLFPFVWVPASVLQIINYKKMVLVIILWFICRIWCIFKISGAVENKNLRTRKVRVTLWLNAQMNRFN